MWEKLSEEGYFYQKVALIGTGLIGGSIGVALRERRLVAHISGYDRELPSCLQAVERGAVDSIAHSPREAVQGAELVIIAVPVLSTIELLKEILPVVEPETVVTDVGSTKGWIMSAVEGIMPFSTYFIGGHPMAGSEESGIAGADPALLENAIYVLTPRADTPKEVIDKLAAMIETSGAQPIVLDPVEHDRAVAAVSHLPHLCAAALVQTVTGAGDLELVKTLAAGGFRDSTRIALGNPEVWRDICISNSEALLATLEIFKESIVMLEKYLDRKNADYIEEFLRQARDYRRAVPYRGRGILPELHELIVLVRDTPGVIGHLTGLLGEAGINIDAIEILHVREIAGGSIRLGFRNKERQEQAQQLLSSKGYRTHKGL